MKQNELLLKTSCIADTICSHLRNFLRPKNIDTNPFIYIEDKLTPTNNLAFGSGFFKNYRPYLQGIVNFGEIERPQFSAQWFVTELEVEDFFDYSEIIFKKCVNDYANDLPIVLSRLNQYTDLLLMITQINNAIVFDPQNLNETINNAIKEISKKHLIKDTNGRISHLLSVAIELNSTLSQYNQNTITSTAFNDDFDSSIANIIEFSVEASQYLANVTSTSPNLTSFIGENGPFNSFNPFYAKDYLNIIDKEFNNIRSYIKFGYTIKPFFDAKISALFNQLSKVDKNHTEILNENISGLRSIVILNELNAIYLRSVISGHQDKITAVKLYKNSISSHFRLSDTQEYLTSTTLNNKVYNLLKKLDQI